MPDFTSSGERRLHPKSAKGAGSSSGHKQPIRRGKSDAKDVINDIYDTRMLQVLKDSARGLLGGRGWRIAERDEIEK